MVKSSDLYGFYEHVTANNVVAGNTDFLTVISLLFGAYNEY
jgi:hypothetical protein